jgi:hypothetical protein
MGAASAGIVCVLAMTASAGLCSLGWTETVSRADATGSGSWTRDGSTESECNGAAGCVTVDGTGQFSVPPA